MALAVPAGRRRRLIATLWGGAKPRRAPSAPAAEYPDDTWRTTVDITLKGVFWTVRGFGGRMIERAEGSIVITSSIAGGKAFLFSVLASGITGTTLHIDCGYSAR